MKVNVNVRKINDEKLKGIATVYVGDCFKISNVKIVEGENGLFIAMPNYKKQEGEYKDIIFPINSETRKMVEDAILKEYNEPTSKENYKKEPENLNIEVKVVALDGDTAIKGLASIKIEDSIVVNNIRIIEGENGLFVTMPDQKEKDGKYKDLLTIIDDRTKDKINSEILEKYEISKNEQEQSNDKDQEEDLEV